MAEKKESKNQDQEKEIPVFTVLKDGSILKNIFLIDTPPNSAEYINGSNQECEDIILLVGRHPDCNINLEHPSISRYHLRIHSNPSCHKLSVIDLESIHGTWVSGKKIEPWVNVELSEGDTVRLGGSSRVYYLHWVPLSRVYDPFVPPLDTSEYGEQETDQDENCPIETELSCDDLESFKSSNSNKNCLSSMKKLSLLQFPVPNNLNTSREESEVENESPLRKSHEEIENENTLVLAEEISQKFCKSEERSNQNMKVESISIVLFAGVDGDEEKIYTPDKENFTPSAVLQRSTKKTDKVEEFKLSNLCTLSPSKNAGNPNSDEEKVILDYTDIENQENNRHRSILKNPFTIIDGNEDAVTSDIESVTPNTLLQMFGKKMDEAEEIKYSKSYKVSSSKNSVGSCISQEEELLPCNSHKEYQTPKVSGESESREKKMEDSGNSMNYPRTIEKNNFGGYKKRWTMVVDTNCLVHKESWKALKILQGLRGTQLIIPKIVIRELMDINERGSLFERSTDASLALQWIGECNMTTTWWIHVQNSLEGVPAAPTPPSSPHSRFSSTPCTGSGRLLELGSPTAEDHILECALFFRRIMIGQQLIILSNDVALKIKAMSEGVMCETAKDFHQSLVNPFSERFLWPGSSALGPTWSCVDDVVLREKYYQCSLKRPQVLKGGLKLLLLQNSPSV